MAFNSFCAKSLSLTLTILTILPALVSSKFTHIYRGIATDGYNACLNDPNFNFTRETISYRANAGHGFTCIMANIGNDRQTILSAGASILGLIPTAITLLGNKRKDINRIHRAFPLLAFFLSFTGVSVDGRVAWREPTEHKSITSPKPTVHQPKPPLSLFWRINHTDDASTKLTVLAIHILALLISVTVFWQTYDLSQRAVVSWSCWTSFLPLIWFLLGPLIHCGEVGVLQMDRKQHPFWSRGLELVFDTFLKVQFLAGTAILGSLALVSGQNAVKVLAVYGGGAIVMRECATWILEIL